MNLDFASMFHDLVMKKPKNTTLSRSLHIPVERPMKIKLYTVALCMEWMRGLLKLERSEVYLDMVKLL